MKIQRILQANFRVERGAERFQIVLAFTDSNMSVRKFVIQQYFESIGYTRCCYFSNFHSAYDAFVERCSRNGGADLIEYCARQIGEAEIVWETL